MRKQWDEEKWGKRRWEGLTREERSGGWWEEKRLEGDEKGQKDSQGWRGNNDFYKLLTGRNAHVDTLQSACQATFFSLPLNVMFWIPFWPLVSVTNLCLFSLSLSITQTSSSSPRQPCHICYPYSSWILCSSCSLSPVFLSHPSPSSSFSTSSLLHSIGVAVGRIKVSAGWAASGLSTEQIGLHLTRSSFSWPLGLVTVVF